MNSREKLVKAAGAKTKALLAAGGTAGIGGAALTQPGVGEKLQKVIEKQRERNRRFDEALRSKIKKLRD